MYVTDGWTNRRINARTDGQKVYKSKVFHVIPFKQKKNFENQTVRTENERLRNGRMDKRTDKRTDRWTKGIKVMSLI